MSKYDIIIVGGGLGGLCAGALLAQAGKKILVLEKDQVLGGRGSSTTYKGHILDNSGHMPSRQGWLEEVFKTLGLPFPNLFFGWDGLLVRDDARQWKAVMSMVKKEDLRAMIKELIATPYDKLYKLDNTSLKDYVTARFDYEGMHYFWWSQAQSVFGGDTYADFSAGEVLIFLKEHFERSGGFGGGWAVVEGGINSLMNPLRDTIIKNGGEIRTSTKVNEIVIENGAVKGVDVEVGQQLVSTQILPTKLIPASTVICNIPLWDMLKVVPSSKLRPWYVDKIHEVAKKPGVVIYLGYGTDREVKGWGTTWGTWLKVDQTKSGLSGWGTYIPGYAPKGEYQVGFWFMKNYYDLPDALNLDDADNRRVVRNWIRLAKEDVRDFFPDLVEHALWETDHYGLWGVAAVPGARSNLPDIQVPGVKGLYLAGDTTRQATGVGTQAVARSGLFCANRILGKD